MAASPTRGEVWLVDLGMIARVRPCLVLSIPADGENDRVRTAVVPHTTSTGKSRFEVSIGRVTFKATKKTIYDAGRKPHPRSTRTRETS